MDYPPKVFISTSGIGIYGNRGEVSVNENTPIEQEDFLSNLCKDWEYEVSLVNKNIRTVIIRKGLVLSLEDGILAKSILPAKMGLCPIFGSGRQIYSWIHIEDLLHIYSWLIEQENKSGIYNAVAQAPVSQSTFAKLLSKKMYRWYVPFHIPPGLLHLILGEFSASLLSSQNVSCNKLISEGFQLKFPFLENALPTSFEQK
jgi:uncharacterized protein (TIGR01777 family)